MGIAVARQAGNVDRTVNTGRSVRGFVRMAGSALHFHSLGWMREVFDVGVTIGAPEDAMNTGCVLSGLDRDASASVGFHSGLAVASEAAFVLLERMRGLRGGIRCFSVSVNLGWLQNNRDEAG